MQINLPDDVVDAIAKSHSDVAGYVHRLVVRDLGLEGEHAGCFAAATASQLAAKLSPVDRENICRELDKLGGVLQGSSIAEICEDRHAGLP